jgi:acyl-[acyl-carrier-protein] desaturase
MRSAGIDRAVFLQKVYFPIMKYLGINRHEMLIAAKKLRAEGDVGSPSGVHPHAGAATNGVHREEHSSRAV